MPSGALESLITTAVAVVATSTQAPLVRLRAALRHSHSRRSFTGVDMPVTSLFAEHDINRRHFTYTERAAFATPCRIYKRKPTRRLWQLFRSEIVARWAHRAGIRKVAQYLGLASRLSAGPTPNRHSARIAPVMSRPPCLPVDLASRRLARPPGQLGPQAYEKAVANWGARYLNI